MRNCISPQKSLVKSKKMIADLESKILKFIKVERTQKEIIDEFPEYSINEITICLRDLEMYQKAVTEIKYRANTTTKTNTQGFTNTQTA